MSSSSLSVPTVRFSTLAGLLSKLRNYWSLVKDLQTGLLIITAVAGYATACCTNLQAGSLVHLIASVFLSVGGSTILNMAFDRDIDARMRRTAARPIPSGVVKAWEAWLLGGILTAAGLGWSFALDGLFGGIITAGVFLDVLVYTVWLKRRTPFSILLGGLSGGMPALAGRTLALGHMDSLGWLLAFSILLWIPTHIMSFTIKYQEDYNQAGVPTFASRYGLQTTRWIIAISTFLAVVSMATLAAWLRVSLSSRIFFSATGIILMVLVAVGMIHPSKSTSFLLYKGASIYMLLSMIVLISGGF